MGPSDESTDNSNSGTHGQTPKEPVEKVLREGPSFSGDSTRARRSTFFRVGRSAASPVADYPILRGGRVSANEADRQIRTFLSRLAGDRELEVHVDPVVMAQENDLLLLFGPDEEEEFARLALSFPDATVQRWATLLSGGNRSEAFGPRSRAERRDEAAVAREFQSALLRRGIGTLLALALLGLGFFGIKALVAAGGGDGVGVGLRFAQITIGQPRLTTGGFVAGGPPVSEPALTAVADRVVAVTRGEGPTADRIRLLVPAEELPVQVGALSAAVFQHDSGQVALVGPEGWVARSCIRISVTTAGLRPLDVVRHMGDQAECPLGMVGRDTRVTCIGSSALILEIEIPQRDFPKELPEGGVGWAEKVRFGVEVQDTGDEKWEMLAVRGTIEVPVGSEDVVIPRFGGARGDELIVELRTRVGEVLTGSCRLG